MDLGSEPPAVVNLLVNRCVPTVDAATATLIDLAARRILELAQPGPDPAAILVRVRVDQPTGLLPYEQLVFDRVHETSGDRLVPVADMAGHYANSGPKWMARFRAAVVADARTRGLIGKRGQPALLTVLTVLIAMVIAAMVVALVAQYPVGPQPLFVLALIAGWFVGAVAVEFPLLMIGFYALRHVRHTRAGRAAGSRWLGVARWLSGFDSLADLPPAAVAVWDRYLAYGVALGTNPVAARTVDLRTGRVERYTSHYTGQPRPVVVRYPRNPLAYSQAKLRLIWSVVVLLFWTCLGWWLAGQLGGPVAVVTIGLAAVGVLHATRAGYRLVRAAIDVLAPVTRTGQVLAMHPWNDEASFYQLVLDDGRRRRLRPWLLAAGDVDGIRLGDVVQVHGERWTRHGDRVVRPAQVTAGRTVISR
jgi:Predicted membrane protein (DUF2207) C-terminal domain